MLVKFLSTPSARRATKHFFHDPRGSAISIHALREEGDMQAIDQTFAGEEFLSTPSARRATAHREMWKQRNPISIHALREEGDGKRRDVPQHV